MAGKILNYLYPATVVKNKDGSYFVSFPDVPEAKAGATTQKELMGKAVDALVKSLAIYERENRKFPMPSEAATSAVLIPMPLSGVSRIVAHNLAIDSETRKKN